VIGFAGQPISGIDDLHKLLTASLLARKWQSKLSAARNDSPSRSSRNRPIRVPEAEGRVDGYAARYVERLCALPTGLIDDGLRPIREGAAPDSKSSIRKGSSSAHQAPSR